MRGFPTAEAAADALTDAIRKNDDKAMTAILGATWHDFAPGNDQEDDEDRAKFLKAGTRATRSCRRATTASWSASAPPAGCRPCRSSSRATSGATTSRRAARKCRRAPIGRNELAVVQTLLAIIDAQRDYATLDPMKTGVNVYARRLLSSPGKKDGLYWETKPGEPPSPLGPLVAKAQLGDVQENGYYGYRFRLLYSQGPDAPGGAYDYLVKGRMIGGFALIAWPVKYGETGVMTFIASHSGDVYEQDLGPDTAQEAGAISVFNPDKDWEKADMTP